MLKFFISGVVITARSNARWCSATLESNAQMGNIYLGIPIEIEISELVKLHVKVFEEGATHLRFR